MGRPSSFTQKMADAICERLADGESLLAICSDDGMPPRTTVIGWVSDDVQGFSDKYARARELGLDVIAEDALRIADTPVVGIRTKITDDGKEVVSEDMLGHRKLQVDARKWFLSKLAPKKYGDKSSLELTGKDGGPVDFTDTERAAKVQALVALAEKRKESDDIDDCSDLV